MLEALVRRLFTDAAFRRAFLADPAGTIAHADLAPDERVALTRLSPRLAGALGSPTGGGIAELPDPLQWN